PVRRLRRALRPAGPPSHRPRPARGLLPVRDRHRLFRLADGQVPRHGVAPGRMGSAHPLSAPYQAFRTADGYIVIGAGSQGLYRRLCALLGVPELAGDERFDTQPKRMERYRELAAILEQRTAGFGAEELLGLLNEAGIPA